MRASWETGVFVQSLTGLTGFDWALAQLFAVALALVVGSFLWSSAGIRVLGALVVPFTVGAAICVLLVALYRDETAYAVSRIGERPVSFAAAGAVVFIGAAVADFLITRVSGALARCVPRRTAYARDVATASTLLLLAAVGLVGLVRLDDRTASGHELSLVESTGGVAVVEDFELPDQPMDLVMRTESEGYASFGEGSIVRFLLPGSRGGELEIVPVAEGLRLPRGIAIVDDTLIVAELGSLPCRQVFPCKGENVEGASSIEEGERKILRESGGRLLAFEIRRNGNLAGRRVLLDDLPVANTDHGVNAVQTGPDGRVYVTVGNVDRLAGTSRTQAERARPNFELLGTVLSLRPDGRDVQVVAAGIRNVYDLAFDDAGRLYGVDNDGSTGGGWRREELLQIRRGDDFGYPDDGTFGPHTRRTAPPLWVLETVGSAGVEWVRSGGEPKLIVGSCGDVYSVNLAVAGDAAVIRDPQPVAHLLSVPGCVTGIERVMDGIVAMTVFTFGGSPRLYLVDLDN